jgi:hypothetical protein
VESNVQSQPPIPALKFKYCFEVDNKVRREDSHMIEIEPSYLTESGNAVFNKERIIKSLEMRQISRLDI